eukprot:11704-Heterococcus_DN1.PRE.2
MSRNGAITKSSIIAPPLTVEVQQACADRQQNAECTSAPVPHAAMHTHVGVVAVLLSCPIAIALEHYRSMELFTSPVLHACRQQYVLTCMRSATAVPLQLLLYHTIV